MTAGVIGLDGRGEDRLFQNSTVISSHRLWWEGGGEFCFSTERLYGGWNLSWQWRRIFKEVIYIKKG